MTMWIPTTSRGFFAFAFACGCLLALPASSIAREWPTTQFRVDFAIPAERISTGTAEYPVLPEPGRRRVGSAYEESEVDAATRLAHDVFATFFEESLHEIAEILTTAGFEGPSLPLFDDGDGAYFKIHVFPIEDDTITGFYDPGTSCGDRGISASAWLGVDLEDYLPLTPSGEAYLYSTLAHELFHAVQASYPATADVLGGCSAGNLARPAMEGTAEGLAYALAKRRWPTYYLDYEIDISDTGLQIMSPGRDVANTYLLGLRPYYFSFLDTSELQSEDKKRTASYLSQSFWLHVSERYGIEFLDFLLRQPLRSGSASAMAGWLDDALKLYRPGTDGLYTVFPHFVAEFSSHAGSRIPAEQFDRELLGNPIALGVRSNSVDGALEAPRTLQRWWMDEIGGCEQVDLVAGQYETAISFFRLRPLSARCLEIRWEGFDGSFRLAIEAEHESLRLLDQVNLGLAYQEQDGEESYCYNAVIEHYDDPLWSCMYEKPFITNGPRVLQYVKQWADETNFSSSGRRFLILSNVARDAGDTSEIPGDDPIMIRIGIIEAEARDERQYAPPTMSYKGSMEVGAGMSAENLYGIAPSPKPALLLMNIGIPVAGSDDAYGLSWVGPLPSLGYTGPFVGTVVAPHLSDSDKVVSSLLCERHRDRVVGRITRFDRDHLWIDVDADLCEARIPPNGTYPKVSELRASLRIPFGWLYDSANAVGDIVTPGMQVFVDRHSRRVPLVLAGALGPPGSSAGSPGTESGSGPQAGIAGTGGRAVQVDDAAPTCECTCEELDGFDQRASEFKASEQNEDEQGAMTFIADMNVCLSACMREYLVCRIN